jgi:ABC-2 type transport system permease protein
VSNTFLLKAFFGLLTRDLRVLSREVVPFLLRVGMQPLLFLFVFTYVFPRMTTGNPMGHINYGQIVLPGLMAVAIMFSGIAAVALPLSTEFGITREIDDRVMSPVPIWLVGVEKIVFSALQSMTAAALVIPMAYYIPAVPAKPEITNWALFAFMLIVSSLSAGSLGLVIGSLVPPKQIGLVFSIVVAPITFMGCVYYPWSALRDIHVLKWAILINPIVYMSEGLRCTVTPSIESLPWWVSSLALLASALILGRWGLKCFLRRVIS